MARGRTGRKTDYLWASFEDAVAGVDAAENVKSLGITGLTASDTQTVMRLRGKVGITLDATAVDESIVVVFGIIVVSAPAFSAGVASIPSPVTDTQGPWIWQGSMYVSAGAGAAIETDHLVDSIEIDSKAMRHIKTSENLAIVAEVAASRDQGGTFDWSYYVRVLLGS